MLLFIIFSGAKLSKEEIARERERYIGRENADIMQIGCIRTFSLIFGHLPLFIHMSAKM